MGKTRGTGRRRLRNSPPQVSKSSAGAYSTILSPIFVPASCRFPRGCAKITARKTDPKQKKWRPSVNALTVFRGGVFVVRLTHPHLNFTSHNASTNAPSTFVCQENAFCELWLVAVSANIALLSSFE